MFETHKSEEISERNEKISHNEKLTLFFCSTRLVLYYFIDPRKDERQSWPGRDLNAAESRRTNIAIRPSGTLTILPNRPPNVSEMLRKYWKEPMLNIKRKWLIWIDFRNLHIKRRRRICLYTKEKKNISTLLYNVERKKRRLFHPSRNPSEEIIFLLGEFFQKSFGGGGGKLVNACCLEH